MASAIQVIDLGFVNSYLVRAGEGFILVDGGMRGQREQLEKALAGACCQPGTLKLVIFTHGDIDHTANGAYLRGKYQVRLAMHRGDTAMVENGELQPKRKVTSRLLRLMHAVMGLMGSTHKMVASFERFKPDLYLEEGQSLAEYGFDARVLHLPGHSAGSIGLLTPQGDLISGDTLENRDGPHPTRIVADEVELNATLAQLAKLPLTTIYPGHGKPFAWEQYKEKLSQ